MTATKDILEAMWAALDGIYATRLGERRVKREWKKLLETNNRTRVVVKLGNGHWLCSSDSRPGDYHSVEYAGGSDYRCSCESMQMHKNESCHHVDQIREVEQHV